MPGLDAEQLDMWGYWDERQKASEEKAEKAKLIQKAKRKVTESEKKPSFEKQVDDLI